MKKDLVLDRNYLSYWLRQIKKEWELIGPMKGRGDDFVFRTVESIHEIDSDGVPAEPPAKEFIFPQLEEMFEHSAGKVKDRRSTDKRVVFGVRACDISAVNLTDRFYSGNTEPSYDRMHPNSKFTDSYYMSRRMNTVFISVCCTDPAPTCFCNSLETGPFLESGFDIQLMDLGDRFFVQTDSEHGKNIIEKHRHLFVDAGKQDYEDQYEVSLSTQTKFEKRVDLEETRQRILTGRAGDSLWEWVAARCFECGGCVYECPVCTCFNIVDMHEILPGRRKGKDKRARIWDTCFFKGFTRMAGGNVPAEMKTTRTKRWWFHKLVHYPEQFRQFGCVGCGRCTITCPGRIDMATVSDKINKWRSD